MDAERASESYDQNCAKGTEDRRVEAPEAHGTSSQDNQNASVKVESPVSARGSDSRAATRSAGPGNSRRGRHRLHTPDLRDGPNMPLHGPEALDVIFRLGIVTIEQAAQLVPAAVGNDRMEKILRALVSGDVSSKPSKRRGGHSGSAHLTEDHPELLKSVTHPFKYSGSGGEVHWRKVYYLSGDGLAYVARRRDLYPSVAEQLYRGVLEQARIDHALLRNEFYRRLAAQIPRAVPEGTDDEGLRIEEMWAEKGMTPIKLDGVEGNDRRYLNPDGAVEIAGMDGSPPRSYRLKIYVESDTGSEDMEWQVTGHADKYAEHFLGCLQSQSQDGGAGSSADVELPVVVFVSPGPKRTRWVRNKIRQNGLESSSVFNAAMGAFKEQGLSLARLYWFTNLGWLTASGGPAGPSYWPLSAGKDASLEPLISP